MYINLSGLIVLITGGNTGLGKSIGMRVAESGATVVLQYPKATNETEELIQALGQARGYAADLSQPKVPGQLCNDVLKDMGSIDVLINCISSFKPSSLEDSDTNWYEAWRHMFAVHFDSTVLLSKQLVQYWRKNHLPGRIINVSVPALTKEPQGTNLAHWVSKKSIELFVQALSQTIYTDKIRLFNIIPPPIREDKHVHFNKNKDEPQQHKGTARDVAPLATFLCSGLADYASGSTIDMSVAV